MKRGLSHAAPATQAHTLHLLLSTVYLGEHMSKTKPDISECGKNRFYSVTTASGTELRSILTCAEVTRLLKRE